MPLIGWIWGAIISYRFAEEQFVLATSEWIWKEPLAVSITLFETVLRIGEENTVVREYWRFGDPRYYVSISLYTLNIFKALRWHFSVVDRPLKRRTGLSFMSLFPPCACGEKG